MKVGGVEKGQHAKSLLQVKISAKAESQSNTSTRVTSTQVLVWVSMVKRTAQSLQGPPAAS